MSFDRFATDRETEQMDDEMKATVVIKSLKRRGIHKVVSSKLAKPRPFYLTA